MEILLQLAVSIWQFFPLRFTELWLTPDSFKDVAVLTLSSFFILTASFSYDTNSMFYQRLKSLLIPAYPPFTRQEANRLMRFTFKADL